MKDFKEIRLSAIMREFNISIIKITEFLSSKGHFIEPKPTSEINEIQYNLIFDEFSNNKKDHTILWVEDEELEGFEEMIREKYNLIKVKNKVQFDKQIKNPEKFDAAILDAKIPNEKNETRTLLGYLRSKCEKNNIKSFVFSAQLHEDPEKYDEYSYIKNIFEKSISGFEKLDKELDKYFKNSIISKYPNLYESCKKGFLRNSNLWDKIEPYLEVFYSRKYSPDEFDRKIKKFDFNSFRRSLEGFVVYCQEVGFVPEGINNVKSLYLYMDGHDTKIDETIKDNKTYNRVACKRKDILTYKIEKHMNKNKRYAFEFIYNVLNSLSHNTNKVDIPVFTSKRTIFFMYLELMEFLIKFIETKFIPHEEEFLPWEYKFKKTYNK